MTKKKGLLICLGLLIVAGLLVAFLVLGDRDQRGHKLYQWVPYNLSEDRVEIEILSAQPGLPGQYQAKVSFVLGVNHRVPEGSPLERVENVFYADAIVEYFVQPHPSILLGVSHSRTYRLGTLEPGIYRFRFYSNGVFVKETSFRVIGEIIEPPREPDVRFAGGSGTANAPYQIADWNQLHLMRDYPEGYFVLINDLDATTAGYEELASPTANDGKGWQPIETSFIGTLDGQGYEIRDLFINRPAEDCVGLFSRLGIGGIVKDVGVMDADITGRVKVGGLVGINRGFLSSTYSAGSVTGSHNVGGLIGDNRKGVVDNSYSTSNVSSRGIWAGGLIGWNDGTVSDSYATGNVTGENNVGGLIGWNEGTVKNSYATGSVTGKEYYAGGLIGYNFSGAVSNSYATGSVRGKYDVGGLVGRNDANISNSYSTGIVTGCEWVGGLIGRNWGGTVRNSFWDTKTSGQDSSAGGTGKTTAEMKNLATYTGAATEGLDEPWDMVLVEDFDPGDPSAWYIAHGVDYPRLYFQHPDYPPVAWSNSG